MWIPKYYSHILKLVTVEFSVYLYTHIKMDMFIMHMDLLACAHV